MNFIRVIFYEQRFGGGPGCHDYESTSIELMEENGIPFRYVTYERI